MTKLKKAEKRRQLERKWKAEGKCNRCGRARDNLLFLTCTDCRMKNKRVRKRIELKRQQQDLCTRCGKNVSTQGYKLCKYCIEQINKAKKNNKLTHANTPDKRPRKVYPILGTIDAVETYKRFGYPATAISPSDRRKVVFRCTGCNLFIERMRCYIDKPFKCYTCNRTNKNIHEPLGPIDENTTRIKFGYSVGDLHRCSPKPVIAICTICHNPYELRLVSSNINQKCRPCLMGDCWDTQRKTLMEKRIKTIQKRYPNGMPTLKRFGKVVNSLVALLEKDLGRKLLREKMLFSGKRLDIFDPETNVGVEYCGLFWHHENSLTPRDRNYHRDKMQMAQKEGYHLITIFEDEYLEHKSAVINRLLNILHKPRKMVGARKCSLVSVNKNTARDFLNKHHIQGSLPSFLYSYGLEYNGILGAVITGGQHHRQEHTKTIALSRLCFAPDFHVVGGTERLFKKLCSQAAQDNYKKIVSWSDNRWTEGVVYTRLGMIMEEELRQDYSYVVLARPGKRLSKQSQKKKNTGCPKHITERDWALQHGLSRIWDCGKRRWTFSL